LKRLAAILLLGALAACATPQTARLVEDPGSLPVRAELTEVPFFPQEKYYCGPAALAMVLAWSGLPATQESIASQVYTPGREGTLRNDVVSAARRNERLAVPVTRLGDMLGEIAAGHPVMVFQNLSLDWVPLWHFAVAVGYDLEARELYLRSGLLERRVTVMDTFERTWKRGDYWALVVLPPDRLPVSAGEASVLRAAAGIERARRPSEAARAYARIEQRWPGSLGALMGLGNARYAEGDMTAAEAAFRRAAESHSAAPAPWNNLAYVLRDLGRKAEAVAAAEQAVALAGDDAETYRETLREIAADKE
jgi:tetratricopeptide (TPR) repeat protein